MMNEGIENRAQELAILNNKSVEEYIKFYPTA
jgi:hypothetical protein